MMHKTTMKLSSIYKNMKTDILQKIREILPLPMMTFFIAIHKRVFHWLFWLEF